MKHISTLSAFVGLVLVTACATGCGKPCGQTWYGGGEATLSLDWGAPDDTTLSYTVDGLSQDDLDGWSEWDGAAAGWPVEKAWLDGEEGASVGWPRGPSKRHTSIGFVADATDFHLCAEDPDFVLVRVSMDEDDGGVIDRVEVDINTWTYDPDRSPVEGPVWRWTTGDDEDALTMDLVDETTGSIAVEGMGGSDGCEATGPMRMTLTWELDPKVRVKDKNSCSSSQFSPF